MKAQSFSANSATSVILILILSLISEIIYCKKPFQATNNINQLLPMYPRSPCKPNKQSKSREFMRLPNKVLFITTFFNQKLKEQLNQHAHLSHLLPASPSNRKERDDSFRNSPKYELNNSQIHFSLEQIPRANHKFRKVMKQRSLNKDQNKVKDDMILRRIAVDKGKRVTLFMGGNDSFVINTKKSALLGEQHHEIIKKQLQDKFQRTRLNFKQKQRQQELNEVGKALGRRHPLLKKLNKSDDISKKYNQTERFEPWVKNKLSKNGIYDMEQSGNYQEQF